MIVHTMTDSELNLAVIKDYQLIMHGGTAQRLAEQYDRERRKLRIDKTKPYSRCYPIKTKTKNNWLIFLSKPPAVANYKGHDTISIFTVTYYNHPLGIRAVEYAEGGGVRVFNGHLFKRYAERLNLDISEPIEKIKHFFTYNAYSSSKVIPKDGREYAFGVVKDGYILGELTEGRLLLINKTFISKNEVKADQKNIELELLQSMQGELESLVNDSNFNVDDYMNKADRLTAITGNK